MKLVFRLLVSGLLGAVRIVDNPSFDDYILKLLLPKNKCHPNLPKAAHSQSHAPQPTNLIENLTPRQLDVLALVVKSLNNRQIGEQLHLAAGTVRNHVSVIMAKLAVSDRT